MELPELETHDFRAYQEVRKGLARLEFRFGELYRFWWSGGLYWARHDGTGDTLSDGSALALALAVGDHLAALKEAVRYRAAGDTL